MLIFDKQIDLNSYLSKYQDKKIGFVPTMGALHDGHLSLLTKALTENNVVIISIFVNPTQFNNPEDLKKYPRTLEIDIKKIKTLNANILIYAPSVSDIYSNTINSEEFSFDGLENEMEGKFRPGHFNGVGTIVKKLFEITKPTNAYFGEKDFQQLQIVKKLVEKYNISTQIIGCPILREKNGLAMSSRNERLSEKARNEAKCIFEILNKAKLFYQSNTISQTKNFVSNEFKKYPNFELEYFTIANEIDLKDITSKTNTVPRGFIAVNIENIRLIDNLAF